jgi:hypothetical protein
MGEAPSTGIVVTKPAFAAAMAFKERFGETRYNKANRLLAGEFVRDFFRSEEWRDLRVVDRIRHSEIAIELCLIPTNAAVFAAELRASGAVKSRRAAVDLPK